MPYLIIIVLFLSVIPSSNYPNQNSTISKSYIPFYLQKTNISPENSALYEALITGNKSILSFKLKATMKKYGLLHLLTPSGLHLSSIFIIKILPYTIQVIIFGILLFYLIPLGTYLSLERVLTFKVLSVLIKNNLLLNFFIVMLISFLNNNYQKSPLSFAFSLIFWGTILIFKDEKIKTVFMLNFSLYLSALIFNQDIKTSSLIINPFLTFFITALFPFMFINFLLGGISWLNTIIDLGLYIFQSIVDILINYDFFPEISLSFVTIILLYLFFIHKRYKVFCFILCLKISIAGPNPVINNSFDYYVNIPNKNELLQSKNGRLNFIDQKCTVNELRFYCKKKPSHLGGPKI